ncbi:protein transport protein sft2 [Coemansia spiralis]|uniref:Protein transport protein SFT2 n=2 Tax=Coemansia TaxID=4863 RepID=A0A9W8G1V0_9FUNG|nr:Got1/Sft2-like family-domain-containing protein [Coemansia spiralis]KAJ1985975.1 protein transport protein sft2 [Coemansia umbellata]KAJ2618844.1 protein transport protein sft2 [Coemansia sp. RSA 1358]KAJ2669320.1 protein transport protein sft2 [Coemansia spiralis]
MSSFRDALSGLKTSSNHVLPSSEPAGESSGFFTSIRDGASNLASSTGSAISGLTGSNSDISTSTREWFGLTLMQRWIGFGGCAILALFCFTMAIFSLPMMILSPQKFATAFSLGSLCTITGIALLRGPRAHTLHLLSKQRLLFTVSYFGSVFFTLFFSAIMHSYLGTLLFVAVQVGALMWYVVSYFPGGTEGLQSTTMSLAGSARTLLPF